jgi:hypothetical protein
VTRLGVHSRRVGAGENPDAGDLNASGHSVVIRGSVEFCLGIVHSGRSFRGGHPSPRASWVTISRATPIKIQLNQSRQCQLLGMFILLS